MWLRPTFGARQMPGSSESAIDAKRTHGSNPARTESREMEHSQRAEIFAPPHLRRTTANGRPLTLKEFLEFAQLGQGLAGVD
jgi:hypothetical protein